ncbi:hypothetical protein FQZ97_509520 [compost metagenome]
MIHSTRNPKSKEMNLDSNVLITIIDVIIVRFNLKFDFSRLSLTEPYSSFTEAKTPTKPKA